MHGHDVVVHGRDAVQRTEEEEEAEDEFEALLSKTMSESVEKTKIARATTQVRLCQERLFIVHCCTHAFSVKALVNCRGYTALTLTSCIR